MMLMIMLPKLYLEHQTNEYHYYENDVVYMYKSMHLICCSLVNMINKKGLHHTIYVL